MYPASSAASSPVGLSYPLSKQRFCSTSSGSGRSITTAFIVSSSSLQSCRLAPSSTIDKGPPSASTSKLFLVPAFPRSVGLGPVFSPTESRFVCAAIGGLPSPVKTAQLGTLRDQFGPYTLEYTVVRPYLKPVMNPTVIAELARNMIPLASRTQAKNYRLKNTTEIHCPFSPNLGGRAVLGKHRLKAFPKLIRNGPNSRHHFQLLRHHAPPLE